MGQELMKTNLSSPGEANPPDTEKPENKGGWATFNFTRISPPPGYYSVPPQYRLWEMKLTAKEAHDNYRPPSCSSRHWGELCRCKSRVWYRIIEERTGACVWQTLGARTEGPALKQLRGAVSTLWEIEQLKADLLRGAR